MQVPYRVGIGYDLHQLVEGRGLILGGVKIEHTLGLLGHSDADCLTHAICDALLGAAGLRDIGHYFADTDPQYKGIDSQKLLSEVGKKLEGLGYRIGNIDATIIAQAPKLNPHIEAMKNILATTLKISPEAIGLKATTNEKMDAIGQQAAIAAHAICLIYKN